MAIEHTVLVKTARSDVWCGQIGLAVFVQIVTDMTIDSVVKMAWPTEMCAKDRPDKAHSECNNLIDIKIQSMKYTATCSLRYSDVIGQCDNIEKKITLVINELLSITSF